MSGYFFELLTHKTLKLSQLTINEEVLIHCSLVTNTYQHDAKGFVKGSYSCYKQK